MTFAIENTDPYGNLVSAVNYLLANQGSGGTTTTGGLTANSTTGVVSDPSTGVIVSYLYQYMNVRYANTSDGISGFSTSPTGKLYYGIRNSNTITGSSNPADYIWYQVTGGFGTTNFLFYKTLGGRQVEWFAGTASPNSSFLQVTDNVAINLDSVTTTLSQSIVTAQVYQRDVTAPATPTGGTFDFGNVVLTPPSGWYGSVPAGTDPIYSTQNTFVNSSISNVVSPHTTWTSPVLLVQNGDSAVSNYNVPAYTRANTTPGTPTANTGSWNFTTGSGTPPTATDGHTWSLNVPTGNIQLYASYGLASIVGSSGTASSITWSNPATLAQAGTAGADGTSVYYYSVYKKSTTVPTAPGADGNFNFATVTGTPPAGWYNSANATVGTGHIYVTDAQALSTSLTGTW